MGILNRASLCLTFIFGVIVLLFLLQAFVSQFKNNTPSGAVTLLYDLRDFSDIFGGRSSSTNVITSQNSTATELKIANYLASNDVLCGNGRIDSGEDCEPIAMLNEGQADLTGWVCDNCKFKGDGQIRSINSTTGLMEQCDAGDANWVPPIPAVNSCSDNAQCQTNGTCPNGSVSTNLCAYGIYKDIIAEDVVYNYQYGDYNLNCEQAETQMSIDCTSFRSLCGQTFEEILMQEFSSNLSKQEMLNWMMQEGIPSFMINATFLTLYYKQSNNNDLVWRLELTKFQDKESLETFSVQNYGDYVITHYNDYRFFISSGTDAWLWYKGNILYKLSREGVYGVTSDLTNDQKQRNPIMVSYLNQFGSDTIMPSFAIIFTNQDINRRFDVMGSYYNLSDIFSSFGDVLINRSVSDIMEEGETKSYTIDDGVVYEVNVLILSDTQQIVKFRVNGNISEALTVNKADIFENKAVIGVRAILPNEAEEVTGGDLVEFYLGTTQPTVCGNSICETGENSIICSNDCNPFCGNNAVETGEQCDDGNNVNTDDCINCQNARCGDGYIQTSIEECDDGNTLMGDSCSSTCLWYCIETDNGSDPPKIGTTTNASNSYTDYCFVNSTTILNEYYCSDSAIILQNINCTAPEVGYSYCINGECI